MTEHVAIKVAKVEEEAKLPTLKHSGDAGVDFYSLFDTIIPPHSYKIVRTGITVKIPNRFNGLLKPKGRNNHLVGAGVIENTYQGEILFKIFNPTDVQQVFAKGDAVGQLVLIPALSPIPLESDIEEIHTKRTSRNRTGGIVTQQGDIE